jgi:hypothetical protein
LFVTLNSCVVHSGKLKWAPKEVTVDGIRGGEAGGGDTTGVT